MAEGLKPPKEFAVGGAGIIGIGFGGGGRVATGLGPAPFIAAKGL